MTDQRYTQIDTDLYIEAVDRVWQKCLKEHGDNSDIAYGMKVLARELKQELCKEKLEEVEERR